MASIFNRTTSAVEPAEFRMPNLGDVDAEYARLQKQSGELNSRLSQVRREAGALRNEIAGKPTGPAVSDAVAALLGDEPDSVAGKRRRVAELANQAVDFEQAIDITQKRLRLQRDYAKGNLLKAVRPEYERRTKAALEALAAARPALKALADLQEDCIHHDIGGGFAWPYGVREQIEIFEKEAK